MFHRRDCFGNGQQRMATEKELIAWIEKVTVLYNGRSEWDVEGIMVDRDVFRHECETKNMTEYFSNYLPALSNNIESSFLEEVIGGIWRKQRIR